MARATPHITDGILTYGDGIQEHTIAVGSPMWRQWLAAAIIGGTSLSCGMGGVCGTLIGVLIITVIPNE